MTGEKITIKFPEKLSNYDKIERTKNQMPQGALQQDTERYIEHPVNCVQKTKCPKGHFCLRM